MQATAHLGVCDNTHRSRARQPSLVTLRETGAFVAVSGEACGSRGPSEACDREDEGRRGGGGGGREKGQRLAENAAEDMVAVGKFNSQMSL